MKPKTDKRASPNPRCLIRCQHCGIPRAITRIGMVDIAGRTERWCDLCRRHLPPHVRDLSYVPPPPPLPVAPAGFIMVRCKRKDCRAFFTVPARPGGRKALCDNCRIISEASRNEAWRMRKEAKRAVRRAK